MAELCTRSQVPKASHSLKSPTFAFFLNHWLSGLKTPMFKLFLKLEFVANLNKTPYPFMGYMKINVNGFWLNCITWQPAKSLPPLLSLNLVFM